MNETHLEQWEYERPRNKWSESQIVQIAYDTFKNMSYRIDDKLKEHQNEINKQDEKIELLENKLEQLAGNLSSKKSKENEQKIEKKYQMLNNPEDFQSQKKLSKLSNPQYAILIKALMAKGAIDNTNTNLAAAFSAITGRSNGDLENKLSESRQSSKSTYQDDITRVQDLLTEMSEYIEAWRT